MEKNYKVSVIVTIYNRENYLCDCVCSLFMQTLDDIEFIFVDDASTDHSLKVLRDFVEKDPLRKPHVKIIPLVKNGGRAIARQSGMDHVTGEYVIHIDSDDWIDKEMLASLYLKAKETGADIVGCNITHEFVNLKRVFIQKYSDNKDENIRGLLNGDIFPSLCTSLTRTSLIKDNGITFPKGLDTGEDLLFNLQLFLLANQIVGVDKPFYHYRHTEDSGSFHHTEKSIQSVIEVARRIEALMKKTGNYDKFEYDILFRKFSMKCALVTDFKNNAYNREWLSLFPETHSYIWKYKQFSWKRRVELWLAAHNLFVMARCFQWILNIQHKFRHLLFSIIGELT